MIHDLLTKFKKPSVHAEGFLFLVLISFFSCATNNSANLRTDISTAKEDFLPGEFVWQKIENADWAEYFLFENKNYPLRYHCIKINLSSPNLAIVTFPDSEKVFLHKNGLKTPYFKGMTAKEFSDKSGSLLSVNAAPFAGKSKNSRLALLLSTRKIIGIHVADKKVLSLPLAKYSVICFKKSDSGFTGTIFQRQESQDFSEYDFAFGGFFTILKDFNRQNFTSQSQDSRTAMGLSKDGKTLYLLTVEGEIPSKSAGLSYQKCSDIMLSLGVSDALQMDGGGSTSLFINGTNPMQYKNTRKNAVFIGFSNR